jgi:pyridoxamine 5'-phosphate oxidase
MKSIDRLFDNIRIDYSSKGMSMKDVADNPMQQFELWIEEAVKHNVNLPNAMHFATVGEDGKPSGRIILLRGFDQRGFVFFTNFNSRKGNDLKNNNYACMTFFWNELFRQVRIEGHVHKVPASESDMYFWSRPRESQISAVASKQSRVLKSRESLENKVLELTVRFKGQPVPRPSNWGGFYLSPTTIEFWQGMEHRLHDRIRYVKEENSSWTKQRLYP